MHIKASPSFVFSVDGSDRDSLLSEHIIDDLNRKYGFKNQIHLERLGGSWIMVVKGLDKLSQNSFVEKIKSDARIFKSTAPFNLRTKDQLER